MKNFIRGLGSAIDITPDTDYSKYIPSRPASLQAWENTGQAVTQAMVKTADRMARAGEINPKLKELIIKEVSIIIIESSCREKMKAILTRDNAKEVVLNKYVALRNKNDKGLKASVRRREEHHTK